MKLIYANQKLLKYFLFQFHNFLQAPSSKAFCQLGIGYYKKALLLQCNYLIQNFFPLERSSYPILR